MTNELYHHGVKGMKWGIRRKRQSKSSKKSKRKKKTEEIHGDYKKAHSNKSVKSMSDKELRSRINRLRMEQDYSKLKGQKVSKGKKVLDKMNKTLTTAVAITGAGLTLYNNASRIKKILEETGVDSSKTYRNNIKRKAKKTSKMAYELAPYSSKNKRVW